VQQAIDDATFFCKDINIVLRQSVNNLLLRCGKTL